MNVLEATGLSVSARLASGPLEALRDVTFTLGAGRVLGLVGESGAGKSMLGRVIAGDLPPGFDVCAGSLLFKGAPLPSRRRPLLGRSVAFVPQEPMAALDPVQTVARQFGEHLGRLGIPTRAQPGRMEAALAEVLLPDPSNVLARYPFQLSGGMCQRVLLAMAFASNPALLIADEPTTALDVTTQAVIVSLLRRLQHDHGTAVLLITHDLHLAEQVSDDLMVLHAGDVVEHGPASAVARSPRHAYTRALVGAAPSMHGPLLRPMALPDPMPALEAYRAMPGCRFATRCPIADPACTAAVPPMLPVGPHHAVRATLPCLAPSAAVSPAPVPRPPEPGELVLSLVGVSRSFRQGRGLLRRRSAVAALRGVDLEVREGEFVGIVGESGSGKSTLARLAIGIERTDAGKVVVLGQNITRGDADARALRLRTMGMVFQDSASALNPRRSVMQLVTQAMAAHGASPPARQARAAELLGMVGLPMGLLHRLPAQLSGGQRQRVNIARALCMTPRLLIADEIVSGLDVSVQAQLLNLLLNLRAITSLAMLFISHDLAVVRMLCERVAVMRAGEIVEQGSAEVVFATPAHPYTRALLSAVPGSRPAAVLQQA